MFFILYLDSDLHCLFRLQGRMNITENNRKINSVSPASALVLPMSNFKALTLQIGLILAAIVLPALAHLNQLPVRWLLPMHFPILLGGLVYGWRSGLLIGMLAPSTNWLITGYPLPQVLPAMTIELALYGFVAGFALEKFKLNRFTSIVIALLCGRIFFILLQLIIKGYSEDGFLNYLQVAMLPGLFAGSLQILMLPFLAKMWIRFDRKQNYKDG